MVEAAGLRNQGPDKAVGAACSVDALLSLCPFTNGSGSASPDAPRLLSADSSFPPLSSLQTGSVRTRPAIRLHHGARPPPTGSYQHVGIPLSAGESPRPSGDTRGAQGLGPLCTFWNFLDPDSDPTPFVCSWGGDPPSRGPQKGRHRHLVPGNTLGWLHLCAPRRFYPAGVDHRDPDAQGGGCTGTNPLLEMSGILESWGRGWGVGSPNVVSPPPDAPPAARIAGRRGKQS